MKAKVDGWNNFCRVFRFPITFSSQFCFGPGIPTNFQMMDWFNPVPGIENPAVSKEEWLKEVGPFTIKEIDHEYLEKELVPWLRKKDYIKPGYTYLILCDFGLAITFSGTTDPQPAKQNKK